MSTRGGEGRQFIGAGSAHPVSPANLHVECEACALSERMTLSDVLEARGLGLWRVDLSTGSVLASAGCRANLGLGSDEELASIEELKRFIHPDDLVAWTQAFDQASEDFGEFEVVHRVMHVSGAVRWLTARGRVCASPHGQLGGRAMVGMVLDITAQKEAEAERERLIAELAAERARLRAVIDHMPAGVLVSDAPSGRIVLSNRGIDTIFAIPHPNLPADVEDFFASWDARYANGRPVAPHERPIVRAMRGEHVERAEYRYVRSDGTLGWANLSSAPILDDTGAITGGVVIATDVGPEKRAEAALRESQDRHLQLFESPAIGILVSRIDGTITSANDTFLKMLGYDREDLRAGRLNWRALTPPPYGEADDARTNELLTTGILRLCEKAYVHKDGRAIPVVIGGTMLAGSATELIVFTLDIRDRKQAEAEREAVRRRQGEFERQLIGIVSHDLKNPLSTILLSAQMLGREQGLSERTRRHLSRIASAAERSTRMIRDLLDFTRARLGAGIPIDRRTVELGPMFQALVDEVRVAHPDRAIRFDPAGECSGAFDADRLAQVLTNLIDNALKYSPSGSPVHVTLGGDTSEVALVVRNEGPAIPQARLATIFEPLQRGDVAVDTTGRSVGLGLYIVKQIAEAHGGRVEVRSSGEGTEFVVRLSRPASAQVA